MSLRFKQEPNATRATYTPELGEPYFATDTKRLFIGDGTTPGGVDPFATDPYGDLFNVKLYGAEGDGVTNDTAAIQDTIDAVALAGGGKVVFPFGEYIVTGLTVTDPYIIFDLTSGATITLTATDADCIDANAASGLEVHGGHLVGPGKGTADTDACCGIALIACVGCRFVGVEISGFYHGIRPDDSGNSYDNDYINCNIHDCTHTALWPKDGDCAAACRLVDNGTTNAHHGIYINTAVARGVRLIGNHYEGNTGGGVQIYIDDASTVNGVSSVGETFDGNGWGYIIATNHASAAITNLHIAGAVVDGCVVTTGDTGHGIHFIATNGTITNFRVQAVVNNPAGRGLNADAANLSNGNFDVVVNGAGTVGAYITADYCTGSIVANNSASYGVNLNGAQYNHLSITARGNVTSGVWATGATTYNVLNLMALGNTGNGINFQAATSYNRVFGVAAGNTSTNAADSGTDNNLFGLTGAAVVQTRYAGTPEAHVTASPGALCSDTTNGQLYIKRTGTGNTGWKVSGDA